MSVRSGAVDTAPSGSTETQAMTVAFSVTIPRSEARCSFDGAPEKKCSGSPLTYRGRAGSIDKPGFHCILVTATNVWGVDDPLPDNVLVVSPGYGAFIDGRSGPGF